MIFTIGMTRRNRIKTHPPKDTCSLIRNPPLPLWLRSDSILLDSADANDCRMFDLCLYNKEPPTFPNK